MRIMRIQWGLILAMGLMAHYPAVFAQQAEEPGGEGERIGTAEHVEEEKAEAATEEKENWLPVGVSGNVAVYTD